MTHRVQVCLRWKRYSKSRIMARMIRFLLILLLFHGTLQPASGEKLGMLIRGGSIIDGTGRPAYVADIGINFDGRIVLVGNGDSAERMVTVDADGLTVAPGFIDVHTHAENIRNQPGATNFLRMGVTTLVLGNCGSSKTDVAGFFKDLEKTEISPNVATLIGHNTVRLRAMKGSFMRPPTTKELANMAEIVEQAMKDGAVGLSTGLIYLPGTFSKTGEIVDLAKAAAKHDGIYVSHMRSEGKSILNAINELLTISRDAGLPAHVSHIKASGRQNWKRSTEILAALDTARKEGLSITQDQYTYTASSTGISSIIPQKYRAGSRDDFKRLADPKVKREMIDAIKNNLKSRNEPDYSYAVIASWRRDKSLNGLRLPAAAKKRYGDGSLDKQIELVFEIHASGGASGVYHKMIEDDLQNFMANPHTMFASDSSVRTYKSGVPHPRGYGNAARVIFRYVRELKTINLEEAIRRMTSLPAKVFQLKDRGTIRKGAWGDLVIFDPKKIRDPATFDAPHQYATGFDHVIVNGMPVIVDDKHLGTRPGKTIRRGQ